MAIKRFTPIQDTFIVSGSVGSKLNSGGDPLLELGKCSREGTTGSSRILIQFDSEDIDFVNSFGEYSYSASLVLYFSEAKKLPPTYSIQGALIDKQWLEGLGHTQDITPYTKGATWDYGVSPEDPWEAPDIYSAYDGGEAIRETYNRLVDGEYAPEEEIETEVDSGDALSIYLSELVTSQEFTKQSSKDVNLNITSLIQPWVSSSLQNNGILLRFEDESLADTLGTRITYFSSDTHTVYKPYIEFGWDDSVYEPGENTVVADPNEGPFTLSLPTLQSTYYVDDLVKLEIDPLPLYPLRVFSTSSIYSGISYILPENTRWGIKNEYTNEMVVDFDPLFTKVSVSGSSNYFNLDMSVLEPERYYRLLFETTVSGSNLVIDNRNIFKVIRHGK